MTISVILVLIGVPTDKPFTVPQLRKACEKAQESQNQPILRYSLLNGTADMVGEDLAELWTDMPCTKQQIHVFKRSEVLESLFWMAIEGEDEAPDAMNEQDVPEPQRLIVFLPMDDLRHTFDEFVEQDEQQATIIWEAPLMYDAEKPLVRKL